MPPTSSEIEEAFKDIEREVAYLSARLTRLDAGESPIPGSQSEWEASLVCASATTKIYMGCERVMVILAARLDGDLVDRDGNWHQKLLARMRHPVAEHGPVITRQTFDMLDRMRACRHRERNSYGFVLKSDIVFERAREMILASEAFAPDVRRFVKHRS